MWFLKSPKLSFEQHKKEIEITQEEYFDQLSKKVCQILLYTQITCVLLITKVDGTIHKLYKTMEKLEVPGKMKTYTTHSGRSMGGVHRIIGTTLHGTSTMYSLSNIWYRTLFKSTYLFIIN